MAEKLNGDIVAEFIINEYDSQKEQGIDAVKQLSNILAKAKNAFSGHSHFKTVKDKAQSWRGIVGSALEKVILYIIHSDLNEMGLDCVKYESAYFMPEQDDSELLKEIDKRRKLGQKRIPIRQIQRNIRDERYQKIKSQIEVFMDEAKTVAVEPDVDLVVFEIGTFRVITILSIKKVFREKITQVAYWTIKYRSSGKNIKSLLITLDEDREFQKKEDEAVRKSKAIAEADIDGTYVASETKILETENIKDFSAFIDDIKQIWLQSHEEIPLRQEC